MLHSFSYVDDAVEAIIVLAESPNSTGKTYHLPVANPNMTGDQLKNLIEKITNQPLKLSLLTRNMTYLLQFFAPLLSQVREMMYQNEHSYVVSSEKIERDFPNISVTPLADGIQKTVDWYQSKLQK